MAQFEGTDHKERKRHAVASGAENAAGPVASSVWRQMDASAQAGFSFPCPWDATILLH